LSPERLRRFFVEENGDYRVAKFLREMGWKPFCPVPFSADPSPFFLSPSKGERGVGARGWPATYGCLAMRASSLAMFSGDRTQSTQPAAMALRGIESYLADSS